LARTRNICESAKILDGGLKSSLVNTRQLVRRCHGPRRGGRSPAPLNARKPHKQSTQHQTKQQRPPHPQKHNPPHPTNNKNTHPPPPNTPAKPTTKAPPPPTPLHPKNPLPTPNTKKVFGVSQHLELNGGAKVQTMKLYWVGKEGESMERGKDERFKLLQELFNNFSGTTGLKGASRNCGSNKDREGIQQHPSRKKETVMHRPSRNSPSKKKG